MVDDNKDDLSIEGVPVEGIVADELHGDLFHRWKNACILGVLYVFCGNFRHFYMLFGAKRVKFCWC